MTEPRHKLTIRPGTPGGFLFHGHIVFDDGTKTTVFGDERERVIARASEAVAQYHAAKEMEDQPPEELTLDQFGEIVRDPEQHSMKVVS
jgi:hypothetical protein